MHVVSVDWLTISVDCSSFAIHANYSVEQEPYGTSVFRDMYTISMDGKQIAIMTLHPRMKHMDPNLGLVKILNPILYLPNLDRIVENLLFDFRLAFKGVSRVDLCADFHRFNDYTDVQDFIRDFLAVKIWKIGQAKYKCAGQSAKAPTLPHYKRKGKRTKEEEQQKFVAIGKQSSKHAFEYLRFGSHVSDVSAYLYNKTQEFKDVKRKNYIVEMWNASGLDSTQTVWRLEFSIKGNGIKFVDTTSGEFCQKTLDMILDSTLRAQLYNACFLKYWIFRYNDGQVRKDRMKPVNMLNIESSIYEPRAIDCSDETSRENKRMITAMEKTYDEIRIKHQVRDMNVEDTLRSMAKFLELTDWRKKKYGAKYAQLDWKETVTLEQQAEIANRYTTTLFDN